MKNFFNISRSKYNKVSLRIFNSSNRVYRMKFKETLEAYLKDSKLSDKVARICTNRVMQYEINTINNEIICFLNSARKYVEGLKSNLHYSH